MDKLRFLSLASSSSGNCYYLGNSMYGILIDAGVAVRTIKKRLKDVGVGLEQIYAGSYQVDRRIRRKVSLACLYYFQGARGNQF